MYQLCASCIQNNILERNKGQFLYRLEKKTHYDISFTERVGSFITSALTRKKNLSMDGNLLTPLMVSKDAHNDSDVNCASIQQSTRTDLCTACMLVGIFSRGSKEQEVDFSTTTLSMGSVLSALMETPFFRESKERKLDLLITTYQHAFPEMQTNCPSCSQDKPYLFLNSTEVYLP